MMQVNEIKQRFNNIDRSIEQATKACQADTNVPQEVKDCVQQLDQQSDQFKQVLQSQDENRIRQSVDNLEQIGDRAEQALQRASNVNNQVKSAVTQVHQELSDLKQQLH